MNEGILIQELEALTLLEKLQQGGLVASRCILDDIVECKELVVDDEMDLQDDHQYRQVVLLATEDLGFL